ncbi:monocarboxylate transporter 5 isoform X2 [Daktulosphaira vitifoliae]|uniref:monocarboxylate transporter 5 isoform X2 n=1 Tax=Daktulosphaira vitifoliae TaxID=58002 RepID=UPI0021AA5151|nr:monocarboxylate transporter 5 isoform X2 [Daktulosphaira vitifoliae]
MPKKTSEKPPTVSKGPPDGGWGWFVVFGSFMIHIVTDGVTYSFGEIHKELVKVFNESQAATAWIVSLLVGITLCSGPIASIFVNKYGCRAVTIAGAILASVCLAVSVLATNVRILYGTIGVGTGLGFGMIYLPAIVSVTCYFEKYRSLATGIAVCGSGLGTFIFSPLVADLITNNGWQATVLVIAGLVSLCTLFGLLFRPLDTEEVTSENATVVLNIVEPECQPLNNGGNNCGSLQSFDDTHKFDDRKISQNMILSNEVNTNTFGNDLDKKSPMSRFTLSQPELIVTSGRTGSNNHLNLQRNDVCYVMYQKDIFYSGSIKNVSENRRRCFFINSCLGYLQPFLKTTVSQSTTGVHTEHGAHFEHEKSSGICCPPDAVDTIKQMLDLSLLKDPIFILFTISNFLTSIGFNIPYVFLSPQAETFKVSKPEYLLSVVGAANTLGRIVLGFISDKPWVNRLMVYNLCLTICGVATILSVYCVDLITFSIYASVFGFTIGAYVGLTSVILVDLLGLDKLTNAFGVLLLFQGIASLIGPPLGGLLYDKTKSYDPAFCLSGINIAVSGIMLFSIPYVQRYCRRKEIEKMTAMN